MKLERKIEFLPAWDKRDPDPKKNYGIHGVEMRWYLTGRRGAVQFVVYTNWQLPHIVEENFERAHKPELLRILFLPMAADLGYHSPYPMYEGQRAMEQCQLLEQGYCYYDGSGLNAVKVLDLLIEKGGEAVWEYLEKYYIDRFQIVDIDAEDEDGIRLPEGP